MRSHMLQEGGYSRYKVEMSHELLISFNQRHTPGRFDFKDNIDLETLIWYLVWLGEEGPGSGMQSEDGELVAVISECQPFQIYLKRDICTQYC